MVEIVHAGIYVLFYTLSSFGIAPIFGSKFERILLSLFPPANQMHSTQYSEPPVAC
ncbi:predicted protein [Sclerotinia sclerotiorum 1980 UF-70]|uniref:Uncharacterized protein n=1 Tax=Sclerotinia sclerotiorum (strain ATCC 18683 / 1980 / Ss-1) TaxID=665079 RepID=A7EVV1_SCLS1|nr:predicted protein [Sclerotinia sclerotiorum 1980 UF-70]EDN93593.1 predicted protein [Sclerotinia sclerotiorum 1980 UF-70]